LPQPKTRLNVAPPPKPGARSNLIAGERKYNEAFKQRIKQQRGEIEIPDEM